MNLLYCGLLYDYGQPEQGYSYEYYNLESGLLECQKQDLIRLSIFHPDAEILAYGKSETARDLKTIIDENKIDMIFDCMFDDNLCPDLDVLKYAKNKGIKVLGFCPDCSWRQDFLLSRKPYYSHFITTHSKTVDWFHQNDMKVISSQWGCSPSYTRKEDRKYLYDVSFVGQKHSIRGELIHALNSAGIKVDIWGKYWEGQPDYHGYADFKEMVDIFNYSKINLNLSNPFRTGSMPQIKGRAFELPACGAFQLTTPADNIEFYFEPNKEIVIVNDMYEMAHKIFYYLKHEDEREEIALNGYKRAMKDHTWGSRFKEILSSL